VSGSAEATVFSERVTMGLQQSIVEARDILVQAAINGLGL